MKTIFRTLGLGAALVTVMAVGGISVFAQDGCGDLDAINALDTKIRAEYPKVNSAPLSPEAQSAVDDGKSYLEKYGNCEVTKDFSGWLKGQVPKWEKTIADAKEKGRRDALHNKFDAGFTSKNFDDSFAAADEYLSKYPDDPSNISLIVTLGLLGPQQTVAKNTKYNANSERYAKMAIERLKSGNAVPKKDGKYGFQLVCDSKDECISGLTFGIGYMNYYGDNKKEAALPYYYEVTKLPGSYKSSPYVYGTIGDYYFDTVLKLKDEVIKLQQAAKDLAAKPPAPDATEDVKKKFEADVEAAIAAVNAKIALLNGYLERDMDAYSRAYSLAKNSPQDKQYADGIYKKLQGLYTARFPNPAPGQGLDTWIASAVAKPLPDPTSTVTPITDDSATGNKTGEANTGNSVGNGNATSVAANGNSGAGKTATPAKTTTATKAKPRK